LSDSGVGIMCFDFVGVLLATATHFYTLQVTMVFKTRCKYEYLAKRNTIKMVKRCY